jgi:general secretion pathway protein L
MSVDTLWFVASEPAIVIKPLARDGAQAVVMAGSEQVGFCLSPNIVYKRLVLPKMSAAKLKAAIPFALEADCGEDVADLHICHSPQDKTGHCTVAYINASLFSAALDALEQQGVRLRSFSSFFELIPYDEGQLSVCLHGKWAHVRLDAYRGFSIERDDLCMMLDSERISGLMSDKTLNYYCVETTVSEDMEQWLLLHKLAYEIIPLPEQVLFDWYQKEGARAVNLLQGSFKARAQKPVRRSLNIKKALLACVSLWLLILLGGGLVTNMTLSHHVYGVQAKIALLYRHYFPQAQSVVMPVERMQRLHGMSSRLSESDFLFLIHPLSVAKNAVDTIEIKQLDYQAGRVTLLAYGHDFSTIDQFKQSLKQQGLRVQVASEHREGERIIANINIRRGH